MITLTACGTTKAKETKNQTKETKKWEPLKISEQEKTQAQKEVKQTIQFQVLIFFFVLCFYLFQFLPLYLLLSH